MSFNPIKEMTFFLDKDNFFVFRYDFDPRVKELPSEEIIKFETQFYEDFYKLTEMWAARAKEFPAYENPHVEVMLEHTDQYALYRMRTFPDEIYADEMSYLITMMQIEFEKLGSKFNQI